MNPEKLFDYLEGNLNADDRAHLEAQLATDPQLQRELTIAREMLSAVRSRVAGAYVMPPLERYEAALEVVDGFLD